MTLALACLVKTFELNLAGNGKPEGMAQGSVIRIVLYLERSMMLQYET